MYGPSRNACRAALPVAALLLVAGACARFGRSLPEPLEPKAQAAAIARDVSYLSHPDRQGRGLGTEGLEQAARYLLGRFSEIGLEPAGPEGSYFERFDAVVAVRPGVHTALGFAQGDPETPEAGPGERVLFGVLGDDFVPASFSSEGDFQGALLFGGYCVSGEGRDDFAKIEVKAKVVLCLRGLPEVGPLAGAGAGSPYAADRYKVFNAREHGAAAVLLVMAPDALGRERAPLPELTPSPLHLEAGVPAHYLRHRLAERLFALAGRGHFPGVEKRLRTTGAVGSVDLPGLEAGGEVELLRETTRVANVVGRIEAGGLSKEWVLVGAHYDHLGFGGEGSLEPDVRAVHPGADDNASGAAALLETARLLVASRARLGRDVVFALFAGEEAGLLGSSAYARARDEDELAALVGMINFDMVGRMDEKRRLWVFGAHSGAGLAEAITRLSQGAFDLQLSGESYGPSDHTNFLAKEVPAVHLFTGAHADYHRPSDTAEKVNAEGVADVVDLAARLALLLSADPSRPRFTEPPAPHPEAVPGPPGQSGYGPYFGSVPDFSPIEGGGVRFAAIRKGSPADLAGVRAGDVLLKFNGRQIQNLYDFTYALRGARVGERVEVFVRRGDEILRFELTLAERL